MKRIYVLIFCCLAAFSMNSCYQDPEPGVGNVVVLDANDFRVAAAYVRLSQPGQTGNGIILSEGYTDYNGNYSYEHRDPINNLPLEVILDIYVSKNSKVGQGVIKIKPDEVSTEIIHIY